MQRIPNFSPIRTTPAQTPAGYVGWMKKLVLSLLFLSGCPAVDCDHVGGIPPVTSVPPARLHPVINEVSLTPSLVEIFNPHDVPFADLKLVDHEGHLLATIATLKPKEHSVIATQQAPDKGGIALEDDTGILDYVAWSNDSTSPSGSTHAKAVVEGQFSQQPFLTHASDTYLLRYSVVAGDSFGRNKAGHDTNSAQDFAVAGGADSLGPTFGDPNTHDLTEDLAKDDAPTALPTTQVRPVAKWTVMVFADGRDQEARAAAGKYLDQLAAVGSTAEVRLVGQMGVASRAARYELTKGINWGQDRQVLPRTVSRNPGEPQTLNDFISWARTHYPAEKYALILVGHGRGWKGINVMPNSPTLSMAELRDAMGALGQTFDITFLNSCLMGNLEVATQLEGRTRFLVASEEVLYAAFSYRGFALPLSNNPKLSATELGKLIVQSYSTIAEPLRTIALLDLNALPALHQAVNAFSVALRNDMDDVKRSNLRDDNANTLVATQARANSERFKDRNFKDLYDLSSRIQQLPLKAAALVPVLHVALAAMVVDESHGARHENARGLSVHFPKNLLQSEPDDNGFDDPKPASHGYALDAQIRVPLLAGANHAREDDAGFLFPAQSDWDEFLHRFYKPTADACIERKGGCVTEVKLPIGEKYRVSANGSSDGDLQNRVDSAYWDWDAQADSPAPAPIYAENTRYDPCTEDCDRDGADSATDDPDGEGLRIERVCDASLTHTLTVWDEHHRNGKLHDEGPHNQGRHWLHYNVSMSQVSVECVSGISAFPERSRIAPGEAAQVYVQVPSTAWSVVRVQIPPNLEAHSVECPKDAEVCGFDPSSRYVVWMGGVAEEDRPLVQFSIALPSDHPCPHEAITVPVTIDGEPYDFAIAVRCQ